MKGRFSRETFFWANVTAFGALWGVLEISLGSMLHALRVPFTGTLLATLGAAILVIQRQFLPTRGASLATGVVAAMCKSLSPGGIILGPMVGIMGEGLLVELILLPAPKSLWTALLAGGACALWTLVQQVISQVIYFGGRVIALYLAVLDKACAWTGLSTRAGWAAILVLTLLIMMVGMVGSFLGWRLGRAALGVWEKERIRDGAS